MADPKAAIEEGKRFYRATAGNACRTLEELVLGGDWGGNGYTTLDQARRLADVLALGPGQRLLDLGAGRGWPGLYLAATSGCDVVLIDLPEEALRDAAHRARCEGLDDRAAAVVGNAVTVPFRPGSFDAVVHTDVLC